MDLDGILHREDNQLLDLTFGLNVMYAIKSNIF